VNIPIHSSDENVVRAVCMATNSARMMVQISSVPAASIYMVMAVGMSTAEAPSLVCPSILEPFVYTQLSGMYFGVQRWGAGVGVRCEEAVG